MPVELRPLEIVIRLALAAVLGLAIGLERNIHGRPAGLRTHLLVSLGSAVFTILSFLIPTFSQELYPAKNFLPDPARIAAQIVTGIGFLGAGVIIKDGLNVRGLTTAACLWVSAGIGMASGAGFYFVAVATTVLSILGLIIFQIVERFYTKDTYYVLVVTFAEDVDIELIKNMVKSPHIPYYTVDFEKNYETGTVKLKFNLNIKQKKTSEKAITHLVEQFERSNLTLKSTKWYKA